MPAEASKVAFLPPVGHDFPAITPELASAIRQDRQLRSEIANLGKRKDAADAEMRVLDSRRRKLASELEAAVAKRHVAEAQGTADSGAVKAVEQAQAKLNAVDHEIAKLTSEQVGRDAHLAKLQGEYRQLLHPSTGALARERSRWLSNARSDYDLTEIRAAVRRIFIDIVVLGDKFDFRDVSWWTQLFFGRMDLRELTPEINERKAALEAYLSEANVNE